MMGRYWIGAASRVCFMVMGLFVFLFLSSTKAENKAWPSANQNLSPVQAWRSTEYCLEKTSIVCPGNHTLKDSGWLNITNEEGPTFCAEGGCADHTRMVLLCIDHVKSDYKFVNGATIKDLYDTINLGCTSPQGFTGVSKYSTSHGYKLTVSVVAALLYAALVSIALF